MKKDEVLARFNDLQTQLSKEYKRFRLAIRNKDKQAYVFLKPTNSPVLSDTELYQKSYRANISVSLDMDLYIRVGSSRLATVIINGKEYYVNLSITHHSQIVVTYHDEDRVVASYTSNSEGIFIKKDELYNTLKDSYGHLNAGLSLEEYVEGIEPAISVAKAFVELISKYMDMIYHPEDIEPRIKFKGQRPTLRYSAKINNRWVNGQLDYNLYSGEAVIIKSEDDGSYSSHPVNLNDVYVTINHGKEEKDRAIKLTSY